MLAGAGDSLTGVCLTQQAQVWHFMVARALPASLLGRANAWEPPPNKTLRNMARKNFKG
jgi:hypothetical protein